MLSSIKIILKIVKKMRIDGKENLLFRVGNKLLEAKYVF